MKATIDTLASRFGVLPTLRTLHRLRSSTRPFQRYFDMGLRFRRQAAAWSDDRRADWVLTRLQDVVDYARSSSDFWRDRFARAGIDRLGTMTFNDYSRLPVLERSDIQTHESALISRACPVHQLRADSTGGSTGKPLRVWLGPREQGWRESGNEFFMQSLGAPEGTGHAYLWGHHLDPGAAETWGERLRARAHNHKRYDCFRLSDELMAAYHRDLDRWQPRAVVAYASALAYFSGFLERRHLKPRYPTHALVTGAEKLFPHHRQLIETVFDRPVHERYGSRDVGGMAYQFAPGDAGFSVDWPLVLLEPEMDGPASPILVTKLQADAMPLFRYRIGDVARFPAGVRPGHPCFELLEVLGRHTDSLRTRDGHRIDGIQFPHLMKDFPIQEFVIRQKPDYSVEVEVVPLPAFGEEDGEAILQTISANLPGLPVELRRVPGIDKGLANKWRPVVCDVDGPGPGIGS